MRMKGKKENIIKKQMAQLAAGCPFNNFGPCKAERCAFFVKINHFPDEEACIIRATYMKTLVNQLLIQEVRWEDSSQPGATQTVGFRIGESVLDCLHRLEALEAHPKCDPDLKQSLRTIFQDLRRALKTFAET